MIEIKDRIQKLTPEEIKELNVYAIQQALINNANLLGDIGDALFIVARKKGEATIEEAQLKYYKDIVVEQCRAFKAVIQSG